MTLDRRIVLKGAAVAAAATGLAAPALAQSQVKWRMQALWDPGTTPQKFEERFVKRVGELTGGKFTIDLFAGGQIVPAAQAFDAVRGGAFEMMKTFDGYEAGKIPAFAFTSTIPFGFPESDQFEAWFYEMGGLEMAREPVGARIQFAVGQHEAARRVDQRGLVRRLARMVSGVHRLGQRLLLLAARGAAVRAMRTAAPL